MPAKTKKPARPSAKKKKPSPQSQNKALVRKFIKAHNQQDLMALSKLLATNFKSHISDMSHPLNREEYLMGIQMAHHAFSNLNFTIEDMVCEGNKVAARIRATGKQTGTYYGLPPSKRKVEFSGMVIRRILNGKIVEEWQTNDQLSALKQIKKDLL